MGFQVPLKWQITEREKGSWNTLENETNFIQKVEKFNFYLEEKFAN